MSPLAKGFREGGRVKVAVSFSQELFNEVAILAREEGRSFSSQAAILIRVGLRALRRMEAKIEEPAE